MLISTWLDRRPPPGSPGAPCPEAVMWLRSLGPDATMNTAWETCGNTDWMLWALMHGADADCEQGLRLWLCDCADRDLLARGRDSGRDRGRGVDALNWPPAIAVARRYAVGLATRGELRAARQDAYDARRLAPYAARRVSAPAAAAVAARCASAVASRVAWDVADLTWFDAAAAAWITERRWQADRLRMYLRPRQEEVDLG